MCKIDEHQHEAVTKLSYECTVCGEPVKIITLAIRDSEIVVENSRSQDHITLEGNAFCLTCMAQMSLRNIIASYLGLPLEVPQ